MQLSVIIINYQVPCFLEQCLLSVRKAMKGLSAEVFVVDNFSADDSVSWLAPRFPWVHFILNNRNEGFAKANNKAISRCKGDNILFLNPDTLVSESLFLQCLGYLSKNPHVGAVGVRMIDGRGKFLPESKRSFPTPRASFFKMVGLSAMFPHSPLFNEYALGHLDQYSTTRVPVLAGAGMMVRAEIVNKLNGFDEDFFMYGEDIDLSYRIESLGFENHYFADAVLMHFKGESTRKGSFVHIKNFYGAMLIFVKKHYHKNDHSIFSFFLRNAIAIRAFWTLLMNASHIKKPVYIQPKLNGKTLIIGDQVAFADVLAILQPHLPDGMQPERIAFAETANDSICTIEELPGLLREQSVGQLIFCEGEITVAQILALTEKLPSTYARFLFKLSGSDSIIGRRMSFKRID